MRRPRTFLSILAMLLFATNVHAGSGVNLRWSACFGDGGAQNKPFACNVNTGVQSLVASFELGADLGQVSGNEVVIDLTSASATMPAWWAFKNAGTCRQGSLVMSFVAPAAAAVCIDWAQGNAIGGIGTYNIGLKGPNTARLLAVLAVAADVQQNLTAGQEYFSFNLTIDNLKTVGTGACAGCATPVCIDFTSLNVTTPTPANNVRLQGPSNGLDSDRATWQGSFGCLPTPTERRTWGAVKALYR